MAKQILQVFRCWLKKFLQHPVHQVHHWYEWDAAGSEIKRAVFRKSAEWNLPPPPPLLLCSFLSYTKLDCTPETNIVLCVNCSRKLFLKGSSE